MVLSSSQVSSLCAGPFSRWRCNHQGLLGGRFGDLAIQGAHLILIVMVNEQRKMADGLLPVSPLPCSFVITRHPWRPTRKHATCCGLSYKQYLLVLLHTVLVQISFKREKGTGSLRAREIFTAEGLDEGPGQQLVQSMLPPSTYLLVHATIATCVQYLQYLLVGCAKPS